jgi:hypothetical protein
MRVRTLTAAVIAPFLVMPLTTVAADAASTVRFSRVQYDSPGSDTGTNRSLNAEWAAVHNYGSRARSLTGWTIRDPEGHVYRFPSFRLKPGRTVRVHTGHGTNTSTDLYWRQGFYVWTNTGDTAILRNRSGTRLDTCRWGDGSGVTGC